MMPDGQPRSATPHVDTPGHLSSVCLIESREPGSFGPENGHDACTGLDPYNRPCWCSCHTAGVVC